MGCKNYSTPIFLLEIFTAGQILSPKLSSTMQSKSLAIFENFDLDLMFVQISDFHSSDMCY